MELFDEIIQNKQLEDTITERQVLRARKNIEKKDSSEIWSDKVSLLHIKGTQRGGEHGGESRQSHGGAEGTKSDRAVVYVLLITLVINVLRNLVNPLLCNEVDKNINKTRKYPLFLHAPTVPLCLTIATI